MRFYLLLFILLCFSPLPALACSCVKPNMEQGQKSFENSDIVIKATVLSISKGFKGSGPMMKLKVDELIKGDNIPDAISVNYNSSLSACGNNYDVGSEYIFALYDTRSVILNPNNTRGYGYRVMISCHQNQVKYYIDHRKNKTLIREGND